VLELSTSESYENAVALDVDVDDEGAVTVSPSLLQETYASNVSRSPKTRDLYIRTIFYVVTDGTSDAMVGEPGNNYFDARKVTFTPLPSDIKLEEHYYYLGSCAQDQTYELKNASGLSFYDDPELSVIVPATTDSWHWFRIAGTSSYGESGSIDWDVEKANQTSICPEVGDCEERSGKCVNGDKAWHVIQAEGEANYKITVNVLDMTYKIEAMSALLEYYVVGRQNGWSLDGKTAAMFPESSTSVSYTSYFTGAWDCRVADPTQVANGDWSNYGSETEDGSCTKLIAGTGNCIISPEAGYYTLTVDFAAMTYSWTPASVTASHDTIGLIGMNGDWDHDIYLTQVAGSNDLGENTTHNWYAKDVTITSDCEIKFRANSAWTVNWGPSSEAPTTETAGCFYGAGVQNGGNISVKAGTYNVYFNDITGKFFLILQK